MAGVGEIRARITLENEQFRRRMQESRRETDRMGRATRGLKDALKGMGLGLTGLATGIGLAVGASVKVATDFEAAMKAVEAKSGATAIEMQSLADIAKEMGSTTQFSAVEAANALEMLAMAGLNAKQMTGSLPQVLSLASAANIDLATSADLATNIMSGFQLKVEDLSHVTDVLAKTVTSSNSSMSELGEAMKYVAPVAASLNMGIEDTAAALAVMHDNGIKGSMAGTALRGSLNRLVKPSKKSADLMKELGINVKDANGELKPFPELVGHINKRLDGMTNAQKAQTVAQLVGVEAMSGFITVLTKGEDGLSTYAEKLRNSDGAAKKMADTMMDSTKGSVKAFQSALEGLALSVGTELNPAWRSSVEWATGFISSLNNANAATVSSIDADIAKAASLLEQADATDELINKYDKLIKKSGLTTEEIGKLVDIVEELGSTNDPAKIEALNAQFDQLKEKSGLSNEELHKLVGYNSDLLALLPDTNHQISEQGNLFNDNADALRGLNEQKREELKTQLKLNLAQAEANRAENLREIERLTRQMNNMKERGAELDDIIVAKEKELKEVQAERAKALEEHDIIRYQNLNDQEKKKARHIEQLIEERAQLGLNLAEKQKAVDAAQQEVNATEDLRYKLMAVELAQVDLNAEKGKEVETVKQAIAKVDEEIGKIQAAAKEQGGLNAKQRDRLIDLGNEKASLERILGNIQNITAELGDTAGAQGNVNRKIQDGSFEADVLNKKLGLDIDKNVNFTGDGESDANNLHNNLSRTAYKSVFISKTESIRRVMEGTYGLSGDRHQGGTLHDLQRFHNGGSPALLDRPMANEVDVRLLRNEMVLTEGQQANLFRLLDSYVPEAKENSDYDQLSKLASGGNTYITVEGNIDSDLYNEIMRKQTNDTNVKLRTKGVKR